MQLFDDAHLVASCNALTQRYVVVVTCNAVVDRGRTCAAGVLLRRGRVLSRCTARGGVYIGTGGDTVKDILGHRQCIVLFSGKFKRRLN